jgi:hypothetical protein
MLWLILLPPAMRAQQRARPVDSRTPSGQVGAANRDIYLDTAGVIRWKDDRSEVALFGANYVLTTASDYRAAGYIHADRKRMIDEDMAHFARMGWDGMRLTFWGDWEASDSAGNLIANDHLDLLDYLIARARERGIYMLFSPIQLYGSNWPDALDDTTAPGFGRHFGKARMGTDPKAIAAQVNYLRQILDHVNPYTGVALKDEPAILFLELVNEPWHHPEDLEGSVRYIDALTDAVRSTGCTKLVFYNVSQDFRIAKAIGDSKAQGVTFGWYPTGLNSGHELRGNYLRTVDDYPDMRAPELAGLPRIVYEFDTPDLRTGYMYPAIARTFRSVGTQFAAMFAYDMLETASRNLAWQTHYLNLVYTPLKAMSGIIAAEAMRRLPRGKRYGQYPANTRFGDFHVSYDDNLGELVARDAFMYAGSTTSVPPDSASLARIAGYGSSPVVEYDGNGIYFLDRVRSGIWRLEVYPDAVPIADPFEPPNPAKVVTRAIARSWPMTVHLPGLGGRFTVQPVTAGNDGVTRARGGRFDVTPGVYVLSAAGPVDLSLVPHRIGRIGFAEYHAPPPDTVAPVVVSLAPPAFVAGHEAELRARVVDDVDPDSVVAFIRPAGRSFYRPFTMRGAGAYEYLASIPAGALHQGPYAFVVTAFHGDSAVTFPSRSTLEPRDWDYLDGDVWTFDVADATTALGLFVPASDAKRLAFTRIGDAGRLGLFHLSLSPLTGEPTFHFALPVDSSGWSPADYTASLTIGERVRARAASVDAASGIALRIRGLGARQTLHVTLVEEDGTSWGAALAVDSTWSVKHIPIGSLRVVESVKLPEGFPGEWNYWMEAAEGRGARGDRPRLEKVEQLQLSLRSADAKSPTPDGYGVEVESVTLEFRRAP